jgi:hypothetical protein
LPAASRPVLTRALAGDAILAIHTGGRLGIYTPDRLHFVERMKAHDFLLEQFPQHIAVRRTGEYLDFLRGAGFRVGLAAWSVSPFPAVRWLERLLAPLPWRCHAMTVSGLTMTSLCRHPGKRRRTKAQRARSHEVRERRVGLDRKRMPT